MNRREMVFRTSAVTLGLGLSGWPLASRAQTSTKKVLFFSKNSGTEHAVVKRVNGEPSFAEKTLTELGPSHGIEFTFSKDGSLFTPEYLAQFDAFFFYTTGNLTMLGNDKNPPMTPEGKAALLYAVKNGKGFIGSHTAADTFHTGEKSPADAKDRAGRYQNFGEKSDPYLQMLGGEFIVHGKQQKSKMRVVDSNFPGLGGLGSEFEELEEWYSLKEFAKDLHVLLVQETEGMTGEPYERPPYPATWARMHGKGRVFYTSLGHREEVWKTERFQQMLFGGIAWAVRNLNADVTPNVAEATPKCMDLPPPPKPSTASTKSPDKN